MDLCSWCRPRPSLRLWILSTLVLLFLQQVQKNCFRSKLLTHCFSLKLDIKALCNEIIIIFVNFLFFIVRSCHGARCI